MKILMLTSRFGFGYGMGYSAYKEATALVSLGHSVTVVHCYSDPGIARFYDPQITLIYLPIRKAPLIGFLMYFFKLKKFINEKINIKNFDSVYIQSLEFGLLDFARIKTPIFYFARSTMMGLWSVLQKEGVRVSPFAKIIHLVLVALERRCMRHSKKIFVKSRGMVSEVSKLYDINPSKIAVVTGGIDEKDFHQLSESSCTEFKYKLGIPLDVSVVLYAGRVVPQKGLIYLVESSLDLLQEINFAVVVAGADINEPYAAKIKYLIDKSMYKKSFYFLGHINQLDMSSVFSSADCLVTPSLYEPFGMVNLQAAFLGKNIITTDVTGSVDLLSDYAKLKIIKAGSSAAIRSALKEILIQKPKNVGLPIDLSFYSWKSVAEQLSEYFFELQKNKP